MAQTRPESLVLTEADTVPPPHDVTVPEPPEFDKQAVTDGADPETLRELRRLAERVGGLKRLREIVDVLAGLPR